MFRNYYSCITAECGLTDGQRHFAIGYKREMAIITIMTSLCIVAVQIFVALALIRATIVGDNPVWVNNLTSFSATALVLWIWIVMLLLGFAAALTDKNNKTDTRNQFCKELLKAFTCTRTRIIYDIFCKLSNALLLVSLIMSGWFCTATLFIVPYVLYYILYSIARDNVVEWLKSLSAEEITKG